MEQAAAFLLFGVVAAVTPGPSNILLAAAGSRAGVRGGLPCLLGVASAMGAMMFGVSLGLGSLVLGHPVALQALHWGGAAFLLWLAWRIATSAPAGPGDTGSDPRPTGYVQAAILQWVNPKSWIVAASATASFLHPEAGGALAQAATLGGLFVLVALPSGFAWLAFGAAVQQVLHGRRRRAFDVAMGVLLALSAALIIR